MSANSPFSGVSRRALLPALAAFPILSLLLPTRAMARRAASDPLRSWNDTASKKAILAFVDRVTRRDSPDFVPEDDCIATFDNDGTLWAEQPMYFQLLFALDRVKLLAPLHPEWKDKAQFALAMHGPIW
jgi:hypothetical protein